MAKKYYHANVAMDLVNLFENRLFAKDGIEILSKTRTVSVDGKPFIYYTLKAEEGIINPKYELK